MRRAQSNMLLCWLLLHNSLQDIKPVSWQMCPLDHVECLWTGYAGKPYLEIAHLKEEGREHLLLALSLHWSPTILPFSPRSEFA